MISFFKTFRESIQMRSGGFTVVETLVAVTVLAVSVAGPLSIAFQGLRSAELAKSQITASYLAQEGVEFIRAMRDQDYIDGAPINWATTFNTCTGAFGCWIDMPDFEWGVCNDSTCSNQGPVEYHAASGRYGYANGYIDSAYTRIVKMTAQDIDGGAGEYLITSTVSWKTANIDRAVVIRETITNWQSAI